MQYCLSKQLVKQIYSMEIWTDAFINNANIMIDRHHLLAGYSLSYMSIIRGAVIDAHVKRVYQCDQLPKFVFSGL
jgi:hypothetical protein